MEVQRHDGRVGHELARSARPAEIINLLFVASDRDEGRHAVRPVAAVFTHRMKKIKIQYMAFRLIDNTLNNNQQETDGVEAAAKPKCVPMLLVIPCASLVLNGRLLQSAPNLLFSFLFSRPAADGIKTGGGARRKPILFLKFHTAHPPTPPCVCGRRLHPTHSAILFFRTTTLSASSR